jgi:hypothetical protein
MNREARNTLLAWLFAIAGLSAITIFLFYIVIPVGIARGQERGTRDFAVLIFVAAAVLAFANIGYWTYRLRKNPPPVAEQEKRATSLSWPLAAFAVFTTFRLAVGLFVLLLFYGVAVLIFRHAFGVELPNPFGN